LFELKSKVMIKPTLTSFLNINQPLIIAPMFLVSNTKMVIEGMKAGVAGCPALNYRTLEELRASIIELREAKVPGGSFGYNLIVNKSNIKYKDQLAVLCAEK
jgi:nitronate monooxygenase